MTDQGATSTAEPRVDVGGSAEGEEMPGLAYLFAGMCAGAGVVHLAEVPGHSGSLTDAIGFAVVGWLQLALAGFVLARKATRRVYEASLLINGGALVLWVMSRTVGLPVGSHKGIVEEIGTIDAVTAALELGAIAVALALILAPRDIRISPMVAAIAGVAVLGVSTIAIVSPTADGGGSGADHHAAGGTATMQDEMALVDSTRCDLAFNPVSYWQEAAVMGVDTYTGGKMAHDEHDSASILPEVSGPSPLGGRGSEQLDNLISLTNQAQDEAAAGILVQNLATVDDDVYAAWQQWVVDSATAAHDASASGDDNGGHGGHVGPQPWKAMTDQSECDTLADEIALARDTAMKYSTVADAEAAGWRQVTPYVPGIAAHYMNFDLVDGKFEIDKPEMILFDGTNPDSHAVGLSYYVLLDGTVEPTQGFTGENDHYHRHVGLCIKGGITIGPSTMSQEDCEAVGGKKASGSNGWMSHAWVVPGCESPWGVFSAASPTLDSNLSAESGQNDGHCSASAAPNRYDLTAGGAAGSGADDAGDETADGSD